MEFEYVDYPQELKLLLEQIFSDDFMQGHTRFQTFEAFQYSSAVFVNWKAEQLIYPKVPFDNFVKESTEFDTWDAMVRAAADCRFPPQAARSGETMKKEGSRDRTVG